MTHSLPELGYEYSALEPHIDAKTMEIHHTKHHQAYINNLNAALEGKSDLASKSLEEIMGNIEGLPEDILTSKALKKTGLPSTRYTQIARALADQKLIPEPKKWPTRLKQTRALLA